MTTEKEYYSKALGLRYKAHSGAIYFEDGVVYQKPEIDALRAAGVDVSTIHEAKKIFDGTIVPLEEVECSML